LKFPRSLIPATFYERKNRFLGTINIDGKVEQCYIPNPGRMKELLFPGAQVHLLEKRAENRKTLYNLTLIESNESLICIDSMIPNKVVAEAIESSAIRDLIGMRIERIEYSYGDSRLDFLLIGDSAKLILEVKSCTLVRDGCGLFPDAPTKRGSRHLNTLIHGLEHGRSAIFFLIQRSDVHRMRANSETDPEFAKNLSKAYKKGVEVYAYRSQITLNEVILGEKVPVIL
jgi:sugar fermentation stimulation protein A